MSIPKISVLGPAGAGKTCLLDAVKDSPFKTHEPTIGVSTFFQSINYQGRDVKFRIVDVSGQKQLISLSVGEINNSVIALFIVDLSNAETLNEIDEYHKIFLERGQPDKGGFRTILVGTKSDLVKERQILKDDLRSKANKFSQGKYIETSAKKRIGIDELKEMIAELCSQVAPELFPPIYPEPSTDQNGEKNLKPDPEPKHCSII
jgi:small GTP-binding protein